MALEGAFGDQDCQEEEGETEIPGRVDGAKDGEKKGVGAMTLSTWEGG